MSRTSPTGEESFSDFYLSYTRNIQQIISANGTAEFNAIWAEHERTGRPYTLIS
jgi:glutamate dehydrogenase